MTGVGYRLNPTEAEYAQLLPIHELVLSTFEAGWSYEAIAAYAQVPVGTIKSRLSRAREALHRIRDLANATIQA